MKLREAIDLYVAWRQLNGALFQNSALMLYRFCRTLDVGIECDAVTRQQVCRFLKGNGKLTRSRGYRYVTLAGFFDYAVIRSYVSSSPMPVRGEEPRSPDSLPPYVYTRDEVEVLFRAAETFHRRECQLDSLTFSTLLRLLYGTGLRVGEAISLTLADVALDAAVVTVRNAKFFKSRLVPIDSSLAEKLDRYRKQRTLRPLPNGEESTFLAYSDGSPLIYNTVYGAFCKLRNQIGLNETNDNGRAPCLHGLRHAFAVHRLTAWHREGADIQRLLPALSTCLGHADLEGTRVYLTMTPELLQTASEIFDRYINGEQNG